MLDSLIVRSDLVPFRNILCLSKTEGSIIPSGANIVKQEFVKVDEQEVELSRRSSITHKIF